MIGRPFDRLRSGIAHIWIVLQSPQHFDRQIISNLDLARQSQIVRFVIHARKSFDFRISLCARVALNDFNPTGRATGVPAAPVQNIDACIHDAEHEPPPVHNIRYANILNGHLRHAVSPYSAQQQAIPGRGSP